jgi:AraC-like DNA-binding protein
VQVNYESIPYHPDESIACFSTKGKRIVCPYHQHPEYEIAWILRSTGRALVGDSLTRFQAGDLYLLGANLPHIFWNDEDTKEARTVVIQFKRDAFGEKLFDAPEMRKIARLLAASDRGLRWNLAPHAPLRHSLRRLGALRGSERVIRLLEVLQRMAQMPPEAELSSIAYGHSLSGLDSSRMETITQYVRAQLYETVSQSEAARVTGMSVASFRRFFQRTTHRTFPRFVNELRISEVCRQLVSTDLTVTEILYRCGYGNQANFYRRFRQILGLTPEQYRRSLQPLNSPPERYSPFRR